MENPGVAASSKSPPKTAGLSRWLYAECAGETTILRDARFASAHLAALCGERQVETLTSNAAQVAGLGRIYFGLLGHGFAQIERAPILTPTSSTYT